MTAKRDESGNIVPAPVLTVRELAEQLARVDPATPVYMLVDSGEHAVGESAIPSIAVVSPPDAHAYAELQRSYPLADEPTPNDPNLYREDGDQVAVVFVAPCPSCEAEMWAASR